MWSILMKNGFGNNQLKTKIMIVDGYTQVQIFGSTITNTGSCLSAYPVKMSLRCKNLLLMDKKKENIVLVIAFVVYYEWHATLTYL